MKKNILLSLIAILAAVCILVALNVGLENIAAANESKVLQHTMKAMLPGSQSFAEEVYTGEDANIVKAWKGETGFVVETKTYGYAGYITMLIGVSNEGKVVGLLVKDMQETPGLGGTVLTDWQFLARLLNTTGGVAIGAPGADAFTNATSSATSSSTAETETYVDGITGATVTSKAIARCVNSAVGYVTGADVESSATSWGG